MSGTIHTGDALTVLRTLPDESVQCCVTSPPYWGLRDYGHEGQIGAEESPAAFVDALVAVFREVRRVLREDGTCWVNLGDSYCNTDKWRGGGGPNTGMQTVTADGDVPSWAVRAKKAPISGVKPKDMVGIPWRVAFALQADGWWLRSDIIWSKLNPMPESVKDRPTKAHEYVFLLSKSQDYFYDAAAIAERATNRAPGSHASDKYIAAALTDPKHRTKANLHKIEAVEERNARTVWTIAAQPFRDAHFAVFPEEIPRRCILAGTSSHGACAACGAPWSRQVETERVPDRPGRVQGRDGDTLDDAHGRDGRSGNRMSKRTATTGWVPTCECPDRARVRPCVVLDPFTGSGTTLAVADAHQRAFIGIELNPEYADMARRRVFRDGAPLFSGIAGT